MVKLIGDMKLPMYPIYQHVEGLIYTINCATCTTTHYGHADTVVGLIF